MVVWAFDQVEFLDSGQDEAVVRECEHHDTQEAFNKIVDTSYVVQEIKQVISITHMQYPYSIKKEHILINKIFI